MSNLQTSDVFVLYKDGCKHPTRTAFITSLKFYSQVPKSKENTNKPRTITEKTLDQKAKAIRSKLRLRLQNDADANLGLQAAVGDEPLGDGEQRLPTKGVDAVVEQLPYSRTAWWDDEACRR
jgi:hypothetical protein